MKRKRKRKRRKKGGLSLIKSLLPLPPVAEEEAITMRS
jgi:hypothetical protein